MDEEIKAGTIFSFCFDETSKDHIKTIGIWAGINAILALITLALNIAFFVIASGGGHRRSPVFILGATNGPVLVVQAILSIVLNVFLYMASVQLKKGLQGLDNESLSKGFASLRTYYKIYGILVIVLTIIFLLYMLVSMQGIR